MSGSGSPLHSTPSYHRGTPDERHEGGGRLVRSWKDVPATGTMMTLSACGLAADYVNTVSVAQCGNNFSFVSNKMTSFSFSQIS